MTIVFSDLVGSTNLAVRHDPEDLSSVILAYQNCCEQVVRRWGGHVLNYLGDGVVSCFGYPLAHEDSAERAVRAALEIVQEVGTLRPIDDLRMETRIGIATGEVVIGDLEGDESVAGDTPNLAARLQNLAQPDHIVISGSTRRLVDGIFELDSVGKHQLKGFAEPLEVWQVKGGLPPASRFDARHRQRRLSHIGRDTEMARLKALWQDAKSGRGQVAIISGEAGIGKSHLCEALRLSIADEPHTRLRCFCAPFHQNSALYPIINQLERASGFEAGDDNAVRLAKLEARLQVAKNGPSQATALIAALLSIEPDQRYAPLAMTSQRQRIETIAALFDEIRALAAITPLFMVFEDAHWSDPTSLEIQTRLAEAELRDLPILLLITHRPEVRVSIGPAPWIHEIRLDRIEAGDSERIVAEIAQAEDIPETLVADIVAKSDGVPLYIEELTKAVLEMESAKLTNAGRGGGALTLAVPDTLHDSLMARLDRLE
ncbi:MAG: AAA family ATPase, partial [Rhizobiales bacterium]|nr:AAA family ATPase [Hyphomicrobiales bacterium]